MRPLLMPGDSPWRLKAIIGALFVFYVWARFAVSSEPPVVVETLSMQAVVVSHSEDVKRQAQSSANQMAKVRLPDGMHALIMWRSGSPSQGDMVDVQVEVLDDGTRRVSLPDY